MSNEKVEVHTEPGYMTGDTVRHTYVDGTEVSRTYQTPDGISREYVPAEGGGFHGTFKKD
jgi:hypothetical protein